jgi:hypothetical protein
MKTVRFGVKRIYMFCYIRFENAGTHGNNGTCGTARLIFRVFGYFSVLGVSAAP